MENQVDRYRFIGKQIRSAREEEKLSQKDLAEKVGFESATAISLIENGIRKIAITDLENIAQILHRDMDYFLGYNRDTKADFRIALRSENLSSKDKDIIMGVYEMLRNRDDRS